MSSCRRWHRTTLSAIDAGGSEKAARHYSRASNAGPFVRQRHQDRSHRQRGEVYCSPSWIALIHVMPSNPGCNPVGTPSAQKLGRMSAVDLGEINCHESTVREHVARPRLRPARGPDRLRPAGSHLVVFRPFAPHAPGRRTTLPYRRCGVGAMAQ